MKKIMTALSLILLMSQSKAQSLSVGYTHHFKPLSDNWIKNKKVIPQLTDQVSIYFSHQLGNLPITLNASTSISRKKPPPPIRIQYPPTLLLRNYSLENKFEADTAAFSNPKTNSIDFMTGVGFILPHKEESKVMIILNADFGWSLNSKQSLNFYYNGNLTNKTEVQKSQFIINPNIKTIVKIHKGLGLLMNAGYSNLGGFNAGGGLSIKWGS